MVSKWHINMYQEEKYTRDISYVWYKVKFSIEKSKQNKKKYDTLTRKFEKLKFNLSKIIIMPKF